MARCLFYIENIRRCPQNDQKALLYSSTTFRLQFSGQADPFLGALHEEYTETTIF